MIGQNIFADKITSLERKGQLFHISCVLSVIFSGSDSRDCVTHHLRLISLGRGPLVGWGDLGDISTKTNNFQGIHIVTVNLCVVAWTNALLSSIQSPLHVILRNATKIILQFFVNKRLLCNALLFHRKQTKKKNLR